MSFFRIFVLIFILLGTAVKADANFRPLGEALAQEQSKTMINYVLQRCSALMMEIAQRTERGEKREGSEKLIDFMKAGYESFAVISAETISEIKGRSGSEKSDSIVEALDTILELQKMYFQSMENEYLKTGNSFSETTLQDLELCVSLLKEN
jgi:hypothetical protein